MQSRFTNYNLNDPEVTSALDELPLWSAPFGLLLLQHLHLIPDAVLLDIGCGTGFPLLEAAQRLGSGCRVFGIDPWETALKRAELKMSVHQIENVSLIKAKAEALPFEDETFHIIISNNGLNNVDDLSLTLQECFRTAKPGAQLLFTANLPETMMEFYDVMKKVADSLNIQGVLMDIDRHILEKRKPAEEMIKMVTGYGFDLNQVIEENFQYRFIDGTSFLNYHFIRLAFLPVWEKVIPEGLREVVFNKVEEQLNRIALQNRGLTMNIPFACYDFTKPL